MTLFKQIVVIVTFFQTIIFGVIMWQNFNTVNEFVQTQLSIDAKHTANSLGLSITPAAAQNDIVLIETMIASMYDSGYYELISLRDPNGKILIKNYQKPLVPGVPKWFIEFLDMKAPTAYSNIMAGWSQFGVLHVRNSIGAAYVQLWDTFKDIASTFILITLLSFVVLYLSLKAILRPLVRVREQAEALQANDFIFQDKLPMTIELKEVVSAMNSMVEKVKSIFEKQVDSVKEYHELLYREEETQLFNRRYFTLNLQERLKSEEYSAGSVVFFTLVNQNELKSDVGYQKSKILYESIGKIVKDISKEDKKHIFSRIKSSDFAILLSNVMPDRAKQICNELQNKLHVNIKELGLDNEKYFFNFGIVTYNEQMQISDIFSRADFALTTSKSKGVPDVIIHEVDEDVILGREAWRKEIESAIRENRFIFASQKSIDIDGNIFHHELFLRLKDKNGNIKSAGYFMPMINALSMYDDIDKYVIDEATKLHVKKPLISLSINIGKDIILNASSLSWFKKSLKSLSKIKKAKISFETFASHEIPTEVLGSFSKRLRRSGFGFGLDNFIIDGGSLKILQDINPNYIKIQSSIMLDLLEGESGNMVKQSFKTITESMDIDIVATGVESQDEKDRLKRLGIVYFQGSLVQEPRLIEKNTE